MKYYFERMYPYVFSAMLTAGCVYCKINYVFSDNMTYALDACNTVVSLIIGFLGAILPVILGMKNEAKIVKYIFGRDKNKLFLKYIRSTILVGVITLLVAISLYFADDMKEHPMIPICGFYIWIYLLICFWLLTYRCIKNMLDLVFLSEDDFIIERYSKENQDDDQIKAIKDKFNDGV